MMGITVLKAGEGSFSAESGGRIVILSEVITNMTKLKQVDERRQRQTQDLAKRVKELNCLYSISNLATKPGISFDEMLQGVVNLIPSAWQYPEVTCARISLEGQEFSTENFRETTWRQASDIFTNGKRIGSVEVYHLAEKPESDEGPFLNEERSLVNTIAQLVGNLIESRRAEEELKLRARLLDNAFDSINLTDFDGNFLYVNETFCKSHGYSREELIGTNIRQLDIPEYAKLIKPRYQEIREKGQATFESAHFRKDGSIMHVEVHGRVIESGNRKLALSVDRDITERKRMEEALKHSESRYRDLFESASDAIFIRDLKGNIIEANQAASVLSGYTAGELARMNISELLTLESLETVMESQQRQLAGQTISQRYEVELTRKDGTRATMEAMERLITRNQQPVAIHSVARDITEQKRVREYMRTYAERVTKTQEDERKRVARELHDDTAQALVSLGMDIGSLTVATGQLPREVRKRLKELRSRTSDILQGVRSLSQALRPPMLEELGLLAALQELTNDLVDQYGIDAQFQLQGTIRRFPPDAELALFRIAQEALNNVVKHTRATKAAVRVNFSPTKVKLTITDNGQGFEFHEVMNNLAYSGKLGLMGMQERARLLGSTLDVQSQLGKGTTVALEVYQ